MTLERFYSEVTDFLSKPDPRVEKWLLMDSPWKTIYLVVGYILFVKVVGPSWMKNKRPFNLNGLMVAYNFFQVAISSWIFLQLGRLGWFTNYNWRCEPIDYSNRYEAVKIAEVCWICFLVKFLEFIDTVFMVLRKKYSHISVLHVFHHSLVPITVWIGIKYGAGGYNTIFPLLNSFVHVWMYLYYGLSAFGPSVQKYLWWKKYLTKMQMVQFIIVFAYMIQLYIYPTCQVSKTLITINLFKATVFFLMFWNFYIVSYRRRRTQLETIVHDCNSHVEKIMKELEDKMN